MADGLQKSPFKIGWYLIPDGTTSILHFECSLNLEGVEDNAQAIRIVSGILTQPIINEPREDVIKWMTEGQLAIQLGLVDYVDGGEVPPEI